MIMSNEVANSQSIVLRMQDVREEGSVCAENMQYEAKRLVDWREHVKARPLLAVSFCSVVGFVLVRTISRSIRPVTAVPHRQDQRAQMSAPVQEPLQAHWTAPLAQTTKELVATAAKNLLSAAIKKYVVEGFRHDRLSQRTHSAPNAEHVRREIPTGVWLD